MVPAESMVPADSVLAAVGVRVWAGEKIPGEAIPGRLAEPSPDRHAAHIARRAR